MPKILRKASGSFLLDGQDARCSGGALGGILAGLYEYRHVMADERACYGFIHRWRWPHGARYPRRGGQRIYAMRRSGPARCHRQHRRRRLSLRTGTLLQDSRLPLAKRALAIGLLRIGISARALARGPGASRRRAWELPHRLRDALERDVLARKLCGRIEV
ncbi:MAG TPA: hypothetical protein VNK67_06805 [Burkholderiales bacterium]|nr:hypothetical protein [Burkholderiales bacterium]